MPLPDPTYRPVTPALLSTAHASANALAVCLGVLCVASPEARAQNEYYPRDGVITVLRIGDVRLDIYGSQLTQTLLNPNSSGFRVYGVSGMLADGTALRDRVILVQNSPRGTLVLHNIPAPRAAGVLAMGGFAATRRRRRLPGSTSTGVLGLSRDGTTITGVASLPDGPSGEFRSRGFRWTSAGMADLGLPAGMDYVYPLSVSGNGGVIVGAFGNAADGDRAFIWTPQTGVTDLSTYLTSLGVNLTGWSSLANGWAVSADGRTITGWGIYHELDTSYVATIPTPGAAGVLAMCGLMATLRRR